LPSKYSDIYDPDEINLSASFGKGDLPPIHNLRRQLTQAPEARSDDELHNAIDMGPTFLVRAGIVSFPAAKGSLCWRASIDSA